MPLRGDSMNKLKMALVTVTIVACGPSFAMESEEILLRTGRDFYKVCRVDTANVHMGSDRTISGNLAVDVVLFYSCISFIFGFQQSIALHNGEGRTLICLPTGFTRTDALKDIYLKWAERNPTLLSAPSSSALGTALAQRFPCSKR